MGLLDRWRPRPPPRTRSIATPRPEPEGDLHYVLIVLDSCRYDSFVEAAPAFARPLGEVERRYSYASWTPPAHFNLLMGLLPHSSPPGVFASEYYKEDFYNYNERLGAKGIEFAKMVPGLWFPGLLRNTLGYNTHARVSLPVLNPGSRCG